MTHESNGIDIITALILNDISPLCKYRMDLVLQLKVGSGTARMSVPVMCMHKCMRCVLSVPPGVHWHVSHVHLYMHI